MKKFLRIISCVFVFIMVMNFCSCHRMLGAMLLKNLGVPFDSGIKDISEMYKIDLKSVEGLDDFGISFKYPDYTNGEYVEDEVSVEVIDTKNAVDVSNSKDWKKGPLTEEVNYYMEVYNVYSVTELSDDYYWIACGETDEDEDNLEEIIYDYDISHINDWVDFYIGIINDKGILYNISFCLDYKETTKEIYNCFNIDLSEIEETGYSYDDDEFYLYENKEQRFYEVEIIKAKLNREYSVDNLKHWHNGPVPTEIKNLLKKSKITKKLKFSDNCNYSVYGSKDCEKYSYKVKNLSKWTDCYIGIIDNNKKVFYDIRIYFSTPDDYE